MGLKEILKRAVKAFIKFILFAQAAFFTAQYIKDWLAFISIPTGLLSHIDNWIITIRGIAIVFNWIIVLLIILCWD